MSGIGLGSLKNIDMATKNNTDFVSFINPTLNPLNSVLLYLSCGLYIGLSLGIASESSTFDQKRDMGIVIGIFATIGILLSLLRILIFQPEYKTSGSYFYFIPAILFGFPLYLADNFLYYLEIREKKMGDLSSSEIRERFGGPYTRYLNLGKDTERFTFLNTYSYRKNDILPCNPGKTGFCMIRRSVIYLSLVIIFLIILPLLLTIGEMKDNGFTADRYLGHLTATVSGFVGLSIIFILGSVKNADIVQPTQKIII